MRHLDPALLGIQLAALAVLISGVQALAPVAVLVAVVLPGYAVIRLARLADPLLEVPLGMCLSVGAIGLLALVQVYTGSWQPALSIGLVLLAGTAASLSALAGGRSSVGPPAASAREVVGGPAADRREDPPAGTRIRPRSASSHDPGGSGGQSHEARLQNGDSSIRQMD